MTLHAGRIAVRVHPMLPVIWLASALGGNAAGVLGSASALLLHECGHLLFALFLHISVQEIELSPIGGLIMLDDPESLSAAGGFFLAAAGPLFSAGGCFLASACLKLGAPADFSQALARSSLLLCLLNLLPVLPLDGGCMVRHMLSPICPWGVLSRVLARLGWGVSAALCGISVYFAAAQGEIILSPMLAGLYLLYASSQEEKQAPGRYLTMLIARRKKLDDGRALPVEILAVSAEMPVRRLLPRMRSGRYHLVVVLSPDGMRRMGELDEKEICDLVLDHWNDPLSAHINKRRGADAGRPPVYRPSAL